MNGRSGYWARTNSLMGRGALMVIVGCIGLLIPVIGWFLGPIWAIMGLFVFLFGPIIALFPKENAP